MTAPKNKIMDRIEILQGDITRLNVDAIVNAANTSLRGGGGVDGAIHRAAGPELLEACRQIGGCPTGEARITKGYRLPASYVIHTVGPVYHGKTEDSVRLTSCYRNSLQLAKQYRLESVAFPAISCGVYGYPIAEACQIALENTRQFLENSEYPRKVLFVLFSDADYQIYRDFLKTVAE